MMKRAASLFLAVLMLMSIMIPGVSAAEPTDLPASDSPMLENTTDSSKFPRETANLTDVYGQIDTESANEMDSMFSDAAWDRFFDDMDRTLDFEPVEDKEAAPVLKSADHFVEDGGLQAYLKGGNLLMGSQVGLQANKEEKVKILGADNNAGAWVFVVDKDALCFWVKDTDGQGIAGALVTISYLDDAGKRQTRSTVTTGGNTPGIAVFDDAPESVFGILDIQAAGYRAVSVLDKLMEAGEQYTYLLEDSKDNDLYLRGVDLSGKDLMNEETPLSLMDHDTENLSLKVLVTKSGSASFPSSVEIQSANRGKTILTISSTSAYAYDSNTRVYTAEKRWAEQSAGLLQDGDEVAVKVGSDTFRLNNLTVKNAVFNNLGTNKTEMPVTTQSAPGNLADKMGGAGALNSTFQILQVPVTVGFFPDGSMILMASYDITKLAPEMETKYSSLFSKSWNPKNLETTKSAFEVFERSFWENAENMRSGKAVLNSTDKIKCVSNKNYNFSMSFSVFLRSNYNAETKDSYGTGGILFCGSFSGGVTEYFLFTAGPVVIPAYIGFEAGISVKTTLNVSFGMDKPPSSEAKDVKWKYANNGSDDWSGRIEVILSFSVFGGVGVKGVLGACAIGYANMDIAAVLGKGSASMVENPHSFIDVLYGMRIEYYLLVYTGQINLDCLQGAKRIYDSDWTSAQLMEEALENMEFEDLDLEACAVNAEPVLADSGSTSDPAFRLLHPNRGFESASITTLDATCYPDSQIQIVTTKNYTALFRLISDGRNTYLVYQVLDEKTGKFSDTFWMIKLPAGERRSITEYVAVPNKVNPDDPAYDDVVYIGAVLTDVSQTDQGARMRSTDVAAMVVDLLSFDTISSVIVSDPAVKGQYLYSAPMPAGREDYCSVAYAATSLQDSNGTQINTLKSLISAVPTNTNYWISSCEPGAPETRSFTNLGSGKICSNGVIAPNEPTYWQADPYASSDKWLVMKGYGANGFYARDLRCNIRVDIDGLIDPADIGTDRVDFNSIVTNWQYLNGCNYFIAGDSVYWMNKKTSGSSYEWVVEKVQGGSGIVSADYRYAMITNSDRSALYLVAMIGDYDVNVDAGTAVKASNRVQMHTLTVENQSGALTAKLHGPMTIKLAKGEVIETFAALYNSEDSQARGLSIVYTTPDPDEENVDITRIWKQNGSRGMLVTDVQIPNYLVRQGQPVIEIYATLTNYGFKNFADAQYVVTDENGTKLEPAANQMSGGLIFIHGAELYPGESRVDYLQVKPNPNWDTNKEHQIIVDLDVNKYDGDIDDFVNTAALKADNTSFRAEGVVIGGRHFVSTAIENNTLIGQETPIIQAVFDYGDSGKERTMKFSLPTKEQLQRFDADYTGQVYHYDIDMEPIWRQGAMEGLRGVTFSLVDSKGEPASNRAVYVANPLEQAPSLGGNDNDCPSKQFTDVDLHAWYHAAVDYAVENQLMNGVSETKFDPNGGTTRAMLATILYRMEKSPKAAGKNPFTDVKADQWYTDAVIWASSNGIVEGYGDGRFGPMDTLTREQFAAMLLRYAKYKDYNTSARADLSNYTDAAAISPWALEAMRWANAKGLITGRTETTLIPKGNATRAEAAAILMRFQEQVIE